MILKQGPWIISGLMTPGLPILPAIYIRWIALALVVWTDGDLGIPFPMSLMADIAVCVLQRGLL